MNAVLVCDNCDRLTKERDDARQTALDVIEGTRRLEATVSELRADNDAMLAELQRCYDALGENDGTEIHRVTAYKARVNPNCVADSVHATMNSLRADAAQTRAEALEEAAEVCEQLYSHLYGNGAEKQASRSIASAIREIKNERRG